MNKEIKMYLKKYGVKGGILFAISIIILIIGFSTSYSNSLDELIALFYMLPSIGIILLGFVNNKTIRLTLTGIFIFIWIILTLPILL
ncbi:MAG: hypothetical protein Q7S27_02910 [Nanoarchaeota archaeon]|nr:hypothetical protein [Nanoarchaeota archaeon]